MRTIHLGIKDDMFDRFLSFIKLFPQKSVKIYDDADIVFTSEDKKAYRQAIKELKAGEAFTLTEIKKKLL